MVGQPTDQPAEQWPSEAESDTLMDYLMHYYVTQNKIVQKKLYHAHKATQKSIEDIDEICDRYQIKSDLKEFENIKKLNGLWGQLMPLFRETGLAEEDLEKIEHAMVSTPRAIRDYYDALIEQDKMLGEMIEEIQSEDFKKSYQNAKMISVNIQQRPNPMSGLPGNEYEPDHSKQAATDQNGNGSGGAQMIHIVNLRTNKE